MRRNRKKNKTSYHIIIKKTFLKYREDKYYIN
jgi:hypothetical protein